MMHSVTQSDFQNILRSLEQGQSAALSFDADGTSYLRTFRPRERLVLLGGGHIAHALCGFAQAVGFSVTVVDDRPEYAAEARFPAAEQVVCAEFTDAIPALRLTERDYVVIITAGHPSDTACLKAVLHGTIPYYVGMIGSRRRTAALMDQLESRGYARRLLDQVHTPIGLAIGALTPQEIAISIVAELIQCKRAAFSRQGNAGRLVCEDVDFPLLRFLAQDPAPKAVLLVLDSAGSTPAKAGAMMSVDRDGRRAGTIGGGYGEGLALKEARALIGTGQQRTLWVDMTEPVTDQAQMACGGALRVLLADLTIED